MKCGRRLYEILTLFELADNAFFFNHTLEALDCFLEVLCILNHDCCHLFHLLCSRSAEKCCQYSKGAFFNQAQTVVFAGRFLVFFVERVDDGCNHIEVAA